MDSCECESCSSVAASAVFVAKLTTEYADSQTRDNLASGYGLPQYSQFFSWFITALLECPVLNSAG